MRETAIALLLVSSVACTGRVDTAESPSAATSLVPVPTSTAAIVVDIEFPESRGLVVGDVEGRAIDQDGEVVGSFVFESGWILADNWQWGDPVEESGATTVVSIPLPAAGAYVFELDRYVVSLRPCGTCETGFGETSVAQVVEDGDVVQLPMGSNEWES